MATGCRSARRTRARTPLPAPWRRGDARQTIPSAPGSARHGGRRRNGWAVESLSVAEVGPGISVPSLEEALAALDNLDAGLGWPTVERRIVPLFQRIRPYPPGFPEAVRHLLPSGIS